MNLLYNTYRVNYIHNLSEQQIKGCWKWDVTIIYRHLLEHLNIWIDSLYLGLNRSNINTSFTIIHKISSILLFN